MFFIKDMNINKLTFLVVFFLANHNIGTEGVIGVNWGRQNRQRLVPSMVVDLLLQNNVSNARVYTSHEDILDAFLGSGINLTIGVYHIENVQTRENAIKWVGDRIKYFQRGNITRVFLGPVETFFYQNTATTNMEALKNIQDALHEQDLDHVEINFPMPFQLINNSIEKPSEAYFLDDIKPRLIPFLNILRAKNAPFCLEIFPIATMEKLGVPPDFAFADNKSTHVVEDIKGTVYTDIFMFAHDAFVWALEKLHFGDIKIAVTQVGWPTDGYPGANVSSAQRFYESLLPVIASGKGSPKRPNSPIDIFVHALTDENLNQIELPYSRHWGIYRSNGEPKYKIDLSGRGQDIYPARAKGIMRMPQRWCVFNENMLDGNRVMVLDAHDNACKISDCTCTFTGGSCSGLNHAQNVSYAFNMVFQDNFQDEKNCSFGGLATIVTENPSNDTNCVFPVEVVKGNQNNIDFDCGYRVTGMVGFAGKFVILLSTLWALFCN